MPWHFTYLLTHYQIIMANNHLNGDNPYRMSVSEAQQELQDWTDNGGQFRVDAPHSGNNEVHVHAYIDNNSNEDILIQIEPTEKELEDYDTGIEPEEESEDD